MSACFANSESKHYFALQILDSCGQVKQRSPPRISASSIQVGWIIRRPNEVGSPRRIRLNFFWDMNDNLYTNSPFSIICMTDLLSCFRASISKNPYALSSHEEKRRKKSKRTVSTGLKSWFFWVPQRWHRCQGGDIKKIWISSWSRTYSSRWFSKN